MFHDRVCYIVYIMDTPNPARFDVQEKVMTPEGAKVVVTWFVSGESYMVQGENIVEAMRAATLLEEERRQQYRGF